MRKIAARVVVAFAVVGSLTGNARADSETVRLANGNVYEGELVERVPGDHVTIKLATGEVRRFDWSDLAPSAAPPTPTPTPTPTQDIAQPVPTQLGPAPLPPRPAHVVFQSDAKGALLMRIDQVPTNTGVAPFTTEVHTPVCYAPCSADVDANARYFVTGAYVSTSSHFAIPDGTSTLSARTGSSGVQTAGAWMLALGVLSTIVGSIATPAAFVDADMQHGLNGWQEYGLATLGAGVGLVLLSIPFLVAGNTHVGIGDMDVARGPGPVRWIPGGFAF